MSLEDFFRLVNKWHPEYTDNMDSARIFELKTDDVIDCQSKVKYQLKNDPDYCLLPFQTIILTYKDYELILMISDPESDLRGYFIRRNIWIFSSFQMFVDESVHNENLHEVKKNIILKPFLNDGYILIAGSIVPDEYNFAITSDYHCASIMNTDKIIRDIGGRHDTTTIYKVIIDELSTYLDWILGNLLLLNMPDRFIVQVDSINKHEFQKESSRSRSTYILMKPNEIQKITGSSTAFKGSKKTPHERRRHFRTMRSDYFVNKKGKTVVIPATWIGETQIQKNDKIYKVLIDK